LAARQRARRPLSVGEGARPSWPRGQRARRPLSVGEGARPSWPRGSGRDARSPLGKERGHLGRGGSGRDARSPLGKERGHLGRGAVGETPALRCERSAAILAAGQRARRPLSVEEGARPSWPRGSGRDARSPLGRERGHLGRGAVGETPALRCERSAAILAAGAAGETPALRWGRSAAILGAGAAGETPALRWGRSAAILAARQRARGPLSVMPLAAGTRRCCKMDRATVLKLGRP